MVDIIPNTGYYISSISDNGVPKPLADPYVVNNVTVNHNVMVGFSAYPATYTIDAFVSGDNGTAEPVSQTVYSGSSAVIDFTPDTGYRVGSITDNSVTMPVTNPYTISAVTAAHTVVVTFTDEAPPTDTYEVTASVTGGNGTVDPFYQLIDSGADATIDIDAEAGSHIDSVTDNGVPQTITDPDVMTYVISGVTEGHDVEVTFVQATIADYEVLAAVSGGNGTVSPASQDIVSGEDATIDITPDPGYHILRITDNGERQGHNQPLRHRQRHRRPRRDGDLRPRQPRLDGGSRRQGPLLRRQPQLAVDRRQQVAQPGERHLRLPEGRIRTGRGQRLGRGAGGRHHQLERVRLEPPGQRDHQPALGHLRPRRPPTSGRWGNTAPSSSTTAHPGPPSPAVPPAS